MLHWKNLNNNLQGEKLHGELLGYSKHRVGDYRIVYLFDKKEGKIAVLKIEHRQGVYKYEEVIILHVTRKDLL